MNQPVGTRPSLVTFRLSVEPWQLPSSSPPSSSKRYILRLLPGPSIEFLLQDLSTRLSLGFSPGRQFDELAADVLRVQDVLHAWQRGYHAYKHERRVVYHSEA